MSGVQATKLLFRRVHLRLGWTILYERNVKFYFNRGK